MQTIVLFSAAILPGLILLTWSANRFVTGSSALALSFNVSPLIIGLTIVAFGTSAPEMLVSAMAAWQGNSGIAIGNVIGSNIVNMTLVLGLAALITPLTISSKILNREFPLTLVVMLFALGLIYDGVLSRLDGLLLMTGMILVVMWTLHLAHSASAHDPLAFSFSEKMPKVDSKRHVWWLVISGLVILLISSRLLVWGAVGIAHSYGISDLVIGLTIVAVGTSLPELAASVVAARKGEHDIAVGNVVGSSLFNILAVLGIVSIIGPGDFDTIVLTRDYPLMIGLAIALYFMARGIRSSSGHGSIQRWAGGILLAVFVIYQTWLFVNGTA